jgi:signal transduction histidine kinase
MEAIRAAKDMQLADFDRPGDEYLWRALMNESDLAIAIHKLEPNGDIRVVEANAGCAPFGLVDWKDSPGMLLKDAVIPDIYQYVTPRLRLCIETGEPQSYERSIAFPTGQRSWSSNLFPIKGTMGKARYAVAIHRQIPELPDPTPLAEPHFGSDDPDAATRGLIYIFSAKDQKVTFAGGSIKHFLGLEHQEFEQLADPVLHLVHPDDLATLQASLQRIGDKGAWPPDAVSCRVRHVDGQYRNLVFYSKVLELSDDGGWHLIGIASDDSERARLEKQVLQLNNKLATVQIAERRRIAQELHDSAGQHITAAKLALAAAHNHGADLQATELLLSSLRDVRACLDSADREIRSLSYILHPPTIDGQNLATVLSNFAIGYGRRAGLKMDVSIATSINDYQATLAIPLLRIFQEALSNVHRHANATSVLVRLDVSERVIVLQIIDDGIGIANEQGRCDHQQGLGLVSMRERIEELGGRLAVEGTNGTKLEATIPLP